MEHPASKIQDAVSKLRIFRELDASDISRLTLGSCICEHEAHHVIRRQGEPAETGFLVISGRVSLIMESEDRKPLTMNILTPGDLYGIIAVLECSHYPVTLRAQCASVCVCIPRESLKQAIGSHPSVYKEIAHYLFKRLGEAQHLCRMLAHDKLEVKIAAILYKLTTTLAQGNEGSAICDLNITRQELAELCGASVEKVIAVIGSLQRAEYIESPGKGRIRILRRDKLIDLDL